MQNSLYAHDIPIPRRVHKKGNGCRACKLRKVKCDEKRPVWGKCIIHYSNISACDYAAPTARTKSRKPLKTISIPAFTSISDLALTKPKSSDRDDLSTSSGITTETPPSLPSDSCSSGISSSSTPDFEKSNSQKACRYQLPQRTSRAPKAVERDCRKRGSQSHQYKQCSPTLADTMVPSGILDPFSILPAESSPRVHALAYHWNNTLALFPTKINSQYCTNPTWMSQAVTNKTFFNATMYVSSIHNAGLYGQRATSESLYYKAQTIKLLNKSLQDPKAAASDENLATVLLLTHVVSIIGEPNEAEIHMHGLGQMMALRGGIKHYTLSGVFLHMLCLVNHLTAVFSESPTILPSSGIPYKPKPSSPYSEPVETSPLLKPFATSIGFHELVVDVLHELGYLYYVLDVFTTGFLPEFRVMFDDVVKSIEGVSAVKEEREREWVVERLKRLGNGEVFGRENYGKAGG